MRCASRRLFRMIPPEWLPGELAGRVRPNRVLSSEAREGQAVCMSKKYEIYSGRRVVSTQFSVSASQAVIDYVRSWGVKDDEIRRLGVDSVSWRGAQFRAVLVPTESPLMP